MRVVCQILALVALAAPLAGQLRRFTRMPPSPVLVIENRGVHPGAVPFYAQGAGRTVLFGYSQIELRLRERGRAARLLMTFPGARRVRPEPLERRLTRVSYFRGRPCEWKVGLRTYKGLRYRDLWPGVDLVFTGEVRRLKYRFELAPGADPSRIRLRFEGAEELRLTPQGGLRIRAGGILLRDPGPAAYQEHAGAFREVEVRFQLDPERLEVGFHPGEYDPRLPLVIDPVVFLWCGYLGGNNAEGVFDSATDPSGNTYLVGWTMSNEKSFPVRVGPDLTFNGVPAPPFGIEGDAFVAKVDRWGRIVYCGYIGGARIEEATGVAVDTKGAAYVVGSTQSDERTFPVRVGPDLSFTRHPYAWEAWVAKVAPDGSRLEYCGYIGGFGIDTGGGVAVDGSGAAYVVGHTRASPSQGFPVKIGPRLNYGGGGVDAFVAKVAPSGKTLEWCGYIGGGRTDVAGRVAVDRTGAAYVVGYTLSDERTFPVKVGPDLTFNSKLPPPYGADGFIAKVRPDGRGFVYCGYIGGAGSDTAIAVAVDASGAAYVCGSTGSDEKSFPVRAGPDLTFNGFGDAFVAKVDPSGKGLLACGYIGGGPLIGSDSASCITVDALGNVYVGGTTSSHEATFPAKVGPGLKWMGWYDGFVACVDRSWKFLRFCGYIGGGPKPDYHGEAVHGIAVDPRGNGLYLAGNTMCSPQQGFPAKPTPDLPHHAGDPREGFVARLAITDLSYRGIPALGGRVQFHLLGPPGATYQPISSFGKGPVKLGKRWLDLSPDALAQLSVSGLFPAVFQGYRGTLDDQGLATATLRIPWLPALRGMVIYTAFVTVDPTAPFGLGAISETVSMQIL